MRNTTKLLSQTLEESAAGLELLAQSGHTVRQTKDTLLAHRFAVGEGSGILSKMKLQHYKDQILLGSALVCFFATCLYIIYARLFR